MDCSICEGPIEKEHDWELGNNAEPVNSGRCCNKCNASVVIPLRIINMQREESPNVM
jgi:hypothetical protein